MQSRLQPDTGAFPSPPTSSFCTTKCIDCCQSFIYTQSTSLESHVSGSGSIAQVSQSASSLFRTSDRREEGAPYRGASTSCIVGFQLIPIIYSVGFSILEPVISAFVATSCAIVAGKPCSCTQYSAAIRACESFSRSSGTDGAGYTAEPRIACYSRRDLECTLECRGSAERDRTLPTVIH